MNSILQRFVLIVALVAIFSITPGDLPAQIRMDTTFATQGVRPFDQPVNPDLYLIRPGELFEVVFLNARLPSLNLNVNAEGRIVHPNLGVFNLVGKTLSQAREILLGPLTDLYNADEIIISIGSIYPVSIQVVGMINQPGTFVGYTSQRVSEMIDSAGGIAPGGSSRRIVFSGGPEDLQVDIDLAQQTGNYEYDPCLYAGVRIEVQALNQAPVTIMGEVMHPGSFELLPGEGFERLIALAGGLKKNASVAGVALNDPERNIRQPGGILPGDRIHIPSALEKGGPGEVIITGAVAKENRHYPLISETTLADVIAGVGGLTNLANPDRIAIFRRPMQDGFTDQSGARFPIWVLGSDAMSIRLEPQDSIHIPRKLNYVDISGLVSRPGLYPYVAGYTAADYIAMAGGYVGLGGEGALEVLDRVSGITRTTSGRTVVYDGDRIVVKEMIGDQ